VWGQAATVPTPVVEDAGDEEGEEEEAATAVSCLILKRKITM